jgi:hypothetical protein
MAPDQGFFQSRQLMQSNAGKGKETCGLPIGYFDIVGSRMNPGGNSGYHQVIIP